MGPSVFCCCWETWCQWFGFPLTECLWVFDNDVIVKINDHDLVGTADDFVQNKYRETKYWLAFCPGYFHHGWNQFYHTGFVTPHLRDKYVLHIWVVWWRYWHFRVYFHYFHFLIAFPLWKYNQLSSVFPNFVTWLMKQHKLNWELRTMDIQIEHKPHSCVRCDLYFGPTLGK